MALLNPNPVLLDRDNVVEPPELEDKDLEALREEVYGECAALVASGCCGLG